MSNFGDAFKAARKSGKKTFAFGGKSYTTKLKSEATSASGSAKTPKSVPTPSPRPSDRKPTPVASKDTAPAAPADTKSAPATTPVAKAGYAGDGVKRPTPSADSKGSIVDTVVKAVQKSTQDFRENAAATDKSLGSDASAPKTDPTTTASTSSDKLARAKAIAAANLKKKADTSKVPDTAATRISNAADAKKLVRGRNGLMVK